MSDLANFIRIDLETNTITGNIASMAYDIDISGEALGSSNPNAPTFRIFARSPRGRKIEIGGVWQKQNQAGGFYYSLSLNTGHGRLNANLGRFPGQDDDTLLAVIPWGE